MDLWITPNGTVEFTIEMDTFDAAKNVQETLEITDPHVINNAVPGFRVYSISVSSEMFAVVYMEIKYPTFSPTTSPTAIPTVNPTAAPFAAFTVTVEYSIGTMI